MTSILAVYEMTLKSMIWMYFLSTGTSTFTPLFSNCGLILASNSAAAATHYGRHTERTGSLLLRRDQNLFSLYIVELNVPLASKLLPKVRARTAASRHFCLWSRITDFRDLPPYVAFSLFSYFHNDNLVDQSWYLSDSLICLISVKIFIPLIIKIINERH